MGITKQDCSMVDYDGKIAGIKLAKVVHVLFAAAAVEMPAAMTMPAASEATDAMIPAADVAEIAGSVAAAAAAAAVYPSQVQVQEQMQLQSANSDCHWRQVQRLAAHQQIRHQVSLALQSAQDLHRVHLRQTFPTAHLTSTPRLLQY